MIKITKTIVAGYLAVLSAMSPVFGVVDTQYQKYQEIQNQPLKGLNFLNTALGRSPLRRNLLAQQPVRVGNMRLCVALHGDEKRLSPAVFVEKPAAQQPGKACLVFAGAIGGAGIALMVQLGIAIDKGYLYPQRGFIALLAGSGVGALTGWVIWYSFLESRRSRLNNQ